MQSNRKPMMGPVDAVITCIDKYFSFRGAATRAEYWWFMLFCNVFIFVPLIIFASLEMGDCGVVWLIASLLFLVIPSLTVSVRRLHDIGLSGFYYFVNFIPAVGAFIYLYFMIKPSSDRPYGAK